MRIIQAVFTPAERERVRERLVEIAASDRRVISAALVGSLAAGTSDRWSDIDLTFGVDDAVPFDNVLDDWTRRMADEFDAVWLFDLPVRGTTYRVFLLGLVAGRPVVHSSIEVSTGKPEVHAALGHPHDVRSSASVCSRTLWVGRRLWPRRARRHRPREMVA